MQAVQLVNFENGRADLQEDVLRAVLMSEQACNRPVMVLSICGAYRRGKSFLLNFFLRFLRSGGSENWMGNDEDVLEGFDWRFGDERVTTGIYVWPEVYVLSEVAIVLIDTQGTFDKETNLKENTAIVAISALLSSVQVFNVSQRLESHDLTNMQFFLEYGKLVQDSYNTNSTNQGLKMFQEILFLIRDWKFQDKHQWGFEGGMNYLNDFIQPETGPVNTDFYSVRMMLDTCFESVKCCLLPHPGDAVDTGRQFQGQLREIDEDFKNMLYTLVKDIFSPAILMKKRVAGQEVTGQLLMNHARAYISIINSGVLPDPKTMFNILADEIARELVKESRNLYLLLIQEDVETTDDLEALHTKCQTLALENFDRGQKLGTPSHANTFNTMLKEQTDEEYRRLAEFANRRREYNELKNQLENQRKCNEELNEKLANLQNYINEQEKIILKQNLTMDELRTSVQESKNMADQQQEQTNHLLQKIQDLAKENVSQKKKNAELLSNIEQNTAELHDLREKISHQSSSRKKWCTIS